MNRVIIDVREPFEYKSGHVEGAINIPLNELNSDTNALKEIPKDQEIILYCRSGARSGSAIEILKNLGYTNLKNGINKERITDSL